MTVLPLIGKRASAIRRCCHRTESVHGLLVERQGRYEPVPVDLVFPVLHGKHGEDGAIQGLLQSVRRPLRGLRRAELCAVHGQIPHLSRRS